MRTMINNKVVSPEVYTTINKALDIMHANGEELLKTIDKLTAENEALNEENAELRANQIAGRCGDCWAAQEGEIFMGYCRYSDADVTELGYCHEWGKAK